METELAWAAGFFDGEGTTIARREQVGQLVLGIGQTDTEPLERFQQAVGVGTIHGPYLNKKHPHWSPKWEYRARGDAQVLPILEKLWPYLGRAKRGQAWIAMAIRELEMGLRGREWCNRFVNESTRRTSGG